MGNRRGPNGSNRIGRFQGSQSFDRIGHSIWRGRKRFVISDLVACVIVILQVVMTASILYEAVEPQIVWKQLLNAILNELAGDGTQNEVRVLPFFPHFQSLIFWST